jgi:uncharacterized LabA/DUF88 family protein
VIRFGIFVDGSNLIGALSKLNLKIDDYAAFYRHAFEKSVNEWREESLLDSNDFPICQMHRVYWYQVGSMDHINFDDSIVQANLKQAFESDDNIKSLYYSAAGQKLKGASHAEVQLAAWKLFFEDRKAWYVRKSTQLESMRQFNHAIQASCAFISVIECGHWKVNVLNRYVEEKGLDTAFAVDIATVSNLLDVVVLLSGDADAIPAVDHVKRLGKNVGALDLIKGYPPERKGRQASSRLHGSCDFVVRIYEMDLVREKIGYII